jgi:hypothetical protein
MSNILSLKYRNLQAVQGKGGGKTGTISNFCLI